MLGTNGPVSSDSEQNSLINGPRNPLGKCACRYPLSFQAARFLPTYHHHLHMFLSVNQFPTCENIRCLGIGFGGVHLVITRSI